jgi:hypothetical protein
MRLLNAEVTTIKINNRQITKSIAMQLDEGFVTDIWGRIRFKQNDLCIRVIGLNSDNVLVTDKCAVGHSNHYCCKKCSKQGYYRNKDFCLRCDDCRTLDEWSYLPLIVLAGLR